MVLSQEYEKEHFNPKKTITELLIHIFQEFAIVKPLSNGHRAGGDKGTPIFPEKSPTTFVEHIVFSSRILL